MTLEAAVAGDALTPCVGQRARSAMRPEDGVHRVGGEGFASYGRFGVMTHTVIVPRGTSRQGDGSPPTDRSRCTRGSRPPRGCTAKREPVDKLRPLR